MRTDTRTLSPVRLLLVDKNKASSRFLVRILRREGFDIAGEANTSEDTVRLAQSIHPDIVLMDSHTTKIDIVHTTSELLKIAPKIRVVWFGRYGNGNTVQEMLEAGASVFVPTTNPSMCSLITVLHGMGKACVGQVNAKMRKRNIRLQRRRCVIDPLATLKDKAGHVVEEIDSRLGTDERRCHGKNNIA